MTIDLTPVATSLEGAAEIVIPWLQVVAAVLALRVLHLFRKIERTATEIGLSRDAFIGACLLLKDADPLTPNEVLARVQAAREDA